MTVVNATQFNIHYHNSWLKFGVLAHTSNVISSFTNSAFSASSQTESVSGVLMFHINIHSDENHPGDGKLPMAIAFSNPSSGPSNFRGEFTDNMKGVWERLNHGGDPLHVSHCSYTDLGDHMTELGIEVSVKLQLDCSPGREARVTLTQFSHDVCTCTWMNEQCLSYDFSFAMDYKTLI